MPVRIIGTGSYVPEKIVTNEDLEKLVDTSDAWITERTGIHTRRVTGEGTAAMAVRAAGAALERAGMEPEELDMILVGTSTGDFLFPGTACQVQGALGASGAVCFDLSAACSGFLFTLNTAKVYLESGAYKSALVIGADTLSKTIDWSDRSTCVLFGDGAGAAVLKRCGGSGGVGGVPDGLRRRAGRLPFLSGLPGEESLVSRRRRGRGVPFHERAGGVPVRGENGAGGHGGPP